MRSYSLVFENITSLEQQDSAMAEFFNDDGSQVVLETLLKGPV